MRSNILLSLCSLAALTVLAGEVSAAGEPLTLASQGGRPFAGTTRVTPDQGSIHCDHGYVEWQIPVDAKTVPLLMVHASSTKTWQTTFDGREGFQDIFLRRGFPVYLTDLPRTGRAGQGCQPTAYEPRLNNDQASFTSWRLGTWLPGEEKPTFYPGVQFPADDPEALDEFLRIQYPEFNAPENEQVETDALAVLLGEIGPAVVLTHSSTGIRGWITGTKSDQVAAIVSYEPGAVVFPEGEVPAQLDRANGTKVDAGAVIPVAEFEKLTRFPIQIVWGDYVPSEMDPANVGPRLTLDNRRLNLIRSQLFVDAINRHGGKAALLDLPKAGVTGNTHFPMLDLNNVQVADLLSQFLKESSLDR
ncbi:MAG: alpha/beta fold hydrolase [Geminicoccaceae bacterium]